jgi:type II secretory pathway component GspD/PulD (secretin)
MPSRGLILLFSAIFAMSMFLGKSSAQDYVGVLPQMLDPEIAQQLGLDEKQTEALKALLRQRQSAAIGLAAQIKEAPVSQEPVLRANFSAESDALGFKLLNPEQQAKLAKLRVEWLGLLALDDPAVAETLNLADWQKEIVAQWQTKVRAERRGPAAERTRAEAERAIRSEISDSQFAGWQLLAGKIEENTVGPPVPPTRETAPEVAVAAAPPANVPTATMNSIDNSELPVDEVRLMLNFEATPWSEVILWLANEADLSVQSDVIPTGTFKYRDKSRTYSVTETMDLMNGTLLNTGYTLFRQGRMLRCIDFETEQKMVGEILKELADTVSETELEQRGKYEPVKFLFSLERLDPAVVKPEIEQLLSIQGSVVSLPASGQLVVTDMAGNVRTIANYIRRAEDPTSSRGSSIQTLPLKAVNAEEVLSVARPLLGLEEGVNVNEEISISTNTFGTVIYAKGDTQKIENLRDLIKEMDKPLDADASELSPIELPYIDRHRVEGIDMTLAFEIVSQLLAGGAPDNKLAQDDTAKQLVLFARKDDHAMVTETLQKLASEAFGFEVIQLKRLDTQMAIEAVKKFLELPDDATAGSGQPVIDGDLLARQVWVKGSDAQVAQIRSLLEKLEENAQNNDILGDRYRVIQLKGRAATDALSQVQMLWEQEFGKKSKIRFHQTGQSTEKGLPQRTFSPQSRETEGSDAVGSDAVGSDAVGSEPAPAASPAQASPFKGAFTPGVSSIPSGRFVTTQEGDNTPIGSSDIVIMEGPNGLIIHSEDKEALERFESLLRLVADQASLGSSDPTIVYLRNIKATAAKELLESILSGTAGSSGGGGGGLLGDMATSMLGGMGGMMGGLMGGGDIVGSSSGIASGDYSIIADPRLNALVIKAGPSDMNLIEQLLEVIDQIESPFLIETRGQVALIPVITQDVAQVLNTIKGLYGDRIAGASAGGAPGGGGGQPNPADIINALRGGGRGGRGGASSELTEPKISLGADTNTNMLLVIAQPSQIQEIRDLVDMIDRAGESVEEDVAVADFGAINTTALSASLSKIFGSKVTTNSTSSGNSTPSAPAPSGAGAPADDAAAAARRAEFFQRMRDSGAFGGGGGAPGGGSPFGGRGGAAPGGGGNPFGGRGGGGAPQGGGRGGR